MHYHREALRSLAILQFVFNLIACDNSTARLTATMSAATGPQTFELRVRQPAAGKQLVDNSG